jgi:double-stranded uracil-DNA glycosylase
MSNQPRKLNRPNPPRAGQRRNLAAHLATTCVEHPFNPVWAADSRVLILGTIPSRRSRQQGFYYGHPQNRFWKVLAMLLQEKEPPDILARRDFLLRHKIALWDVLQGCQITGSRDSSIRSAIPNDLSELLRRSAVRAIFANGQVAAHLYRISCQPKTGRLCQGLPSTSPANGRYSLADLCRLWDPVRQVLEDQAAGQVHSP